MYCVLYDADYALSYNFDYCFTTWKMAALTEFPNEVIVRRNVFILGDLIYILYDNYRKKDFHIGKCVNGNGKWVVDSGGAAYLELLPVTLFFTEIL